MQKLIRASEKVRKLERISITQTGQNIIYDYDIMDVISSQIICSYKIQKITLNVHWFSIDSEMSGSYGGKYVEVGLLGCDALWTYGYPHRSLHDLKIQTPTVTLITACRWKVSWARWIHFTYTPTHYFNACFNIILAYASTCIHWLSK